ncbi:MAG: glycerol-3-phosphate 1-O-acyltransferase PlsY [Desulfobacterales bacterium]
MHASHYLALMALPLVAYAAGSIPWGLWIARLACGADIRRLGSGNIGATNVRRIAGTVPGILTLAADGLKGAVPVWIAAVLVPEVSAYTAFVGLSVFLGHLYPVFSRFRGGGKGVATAGGVVLALSPAALLTALLSFVWVVCLSSRVSVASLAASTCLPLFLWEATGSMSHTVMASVMALLIWWRHRQNLRRLIEGTEPVIDW